MANNNPDGQGFFAGLWNTISGFFEAQSSKIWNGFSKIFWTLAGDTTEKTSKLLQGLEDKLWLPQVNAYVERGWIDKDTANDLRKLTALNFPYNAFAFLLVSIFLIATLVKQFGYAATTDLKRMLFSKYHPEDIQGQTVIPAAFLDPDKIPQITQILRQNGYPQEQIDLLFFTMQRIYDENTIRILYYRKVLSEEQTYERMLNLGYKEERIAEIIQSWPVIPSVPDILFMVKKEAFKPEIITKYGYDLEFPIDQLEHLQAQGLSEFWAYKYWYSHWEVPSAQMGFDMLHRGIIDLDILNDLFKVADIPPYWRDKLIAIAYTPFTRVDIRRMHQLKVLTDDELISSYMDIGYNYDKAVKMAQFTYALNGEERTNLTKAEILKGYSEGFITKENAVSMLSELKFKQEEIDYFLVFEDYKNEKELQTKRIANIKTQFVKNMIDEFDARQSLTTMNLKGAQIEVLMQSWLIERIVDVRRPTKADLDSFVKLGIITPDQYIIELYNLGYNKEYVSWYLQAFQSKLEGEKKIGS
jgi:hypothetical protein